MLKLDPPQLTPYQRELSLALADMRYVHRGHENRRMMAASTDPAVRASATERVKHVQVVTLYFPDAYHWAIGPLEEAEQHRHVSICETILAWPVSFDSAAAARRLLFAAKQ